ncbi:hypothetical protein [Campylobacter lanienae]|uniref:hypothetical protein n=1 Tax=Campylobacter lanienae TaxID=75658 RepID=UPI000BB420FD|nr:hypothetical protein [Campylobacter lanienae]
MGDNENELIYSLKSELTTNILRINQLCSIDKVKFYKRKFNGLLIAGRMDAFGSRMTAFITAMYLSKKIGFKFGYTWEKLDAPSGVFLDDDEELFEEEFINEFSYQSKLPKGDTNTLCFNTISELNNKPYKKYWGSYVMNYYVANNSHIKDLDEKDYLANFGPILRSIPFKEKYKKAIEQSDIVSTKLGEFVAIHMRGGDSIYDKNFRRTIFSPVIMKYVFPAEVVVYAIKHFIEKEDKKVILFGADIKANIAIKEYLKDYVIKDQLLIASELHQNYNTMQATIFELILMSNANMILANHSTYSKFAAALGNVELKNFNQYFTNKEIYDSIMYYLDRFDTHNIQKSASCAYALDLAYKKLNINTAIKIDIANRGLEFDFNNSIFRVMIIYILINDKQCQRADEYLKNILLERKEEFLEALLRVLWNQHIVFAPQFLSFITTASIKYPYISYIASKISVFQKDLNNALKFINYSLNAKPNNEEFIAFKKEIEALIKKDNPQQVQINIKDLNQQKLNSKEFTLQYSTAKSRIKNQLTYKLGEAMIANSKSLWGYIRMPYILSYIKETHQTNQKLYQEKIKANPSLKLPPLDTYPDYNEAIKIKEHLSYKLGEALINADKSKLKLGYITLWFKCKKITKEHKDNHKNNPNKPK